MPVSTAQEKDLCRGGCRGKCDAGVVAAEDGRAETADRDRPSGCAGFARSPAAPGQGRGETSLRPLVHVHGREQPPPKMSCTRGVWGLPSPSSSANLQRDHGDAAEAPYPSPDTRCDPVCQPKFSPSFHSSDQRGCCRASALSLGWVVSVIPFAENLKQNNQGDPLKFSPGVIHARPFPLQRFEWPYVWVGFPSKAGKLWIPVKSL